MNTVEDYKGECQRLNEALDWLIYNNVASSRKELARIVKYAKTNKITLNQEENQTNDTSYEKDTNITYENETNKIEIIKKYFTKFLLVIDCP